ncbi:hypothetical protein MMC29_001442 [Sticta canariensis]|nr:hypothetical protein [Sticta canariensis]
MPISCHRPRSLRQGDEFYLITYNEKGIAVDVGPAQFYDPTRHEPDSSDSDAGSPYQARARSKKLRERRAAKRARGARRAEVKRKRKEVAAEDICLLEILRLSLETIQLERELLKQQQRRVLERQIQREKNPQEWERQRAFMDAMRQRFHDMQLPVTWDILDTPTSSEAMAPTEEVKKVDASINIQEREDFWDLWVQFDDDNKPLPLPTVADKYGLPDSLFGYFLE